MSQNELKVKCIAAQDVEEKANPKDLLGANKVCMSNVPAAVLMEIAVAMLEGKLKYGAFNYRDSKVLSSVYTDAADRHTKAYFEGRDIDPDSGLPEITKAIASLIILRDAQMTGMVIDDRPKKKLPDGWLENLNKIASDIQKKYNTKARHDRMLSENKLSKAFNDVVGG